VLKCPLDLWLYQEILHRIRPAVIVETGTAFGGSALFLASMCDLIGSGRVVSVDLKPRSGRPEHPRVTYITGSSVAPETLARVAAEIAGASPVMVLLDSDHSEAHVSRELEAYHRHVSVGSYLVVEDTNLNGHPVEREHGPGPWEAVQAFLPRHPEFVHDLEMDKFLLSFNPRGYLKRLR
jgi:cephalosporin hydroxylase